MVTAKTIFFVFKQRTEPYIYGLTVLHMWVMCVIWQAPLKFQSECTYREKAEARVAELEQEVELIRRQLEQFKYNAMTRIHNQRGLVLAHHRNQYEHMHSVSLY